MSSQIRMLDPIAVPSNAPREVRTLDGLAGKTIGFIDNAKPNFNYLVDDLGEDDPAEILSVECDGNPFGFIARPL